MLQAKNKEYYFIAETAFHHEGDDIFLKKLIQDIAGLEIQAIKFHLLFDVEDYMVASHVAVPKLKEISIPKEKWASIFQLVASKEKEIITLTNDLKSLQYINSIQDQFPIVAIELHATGLNDVFLLEEATKFKNTIILGTGGSTFDEIQFAIDFLKQKGKEDILLMHGFQNYPTSYEDINFKRIQLLQAAFQLPIGYADHTDPKDEKNAWISVLPAMIGVKVFEKHVTNVPEEKRIDAQAAISLQGMADVINTATILSKSLGTQTMEFSPAELKYGDTGPMKKAVVAKHDLEAGHIISLDDIAFKRTEISSPLKQKDMLALIGLKCSKPIKKDEILSFENIEYSFQVEDFSQFFIQK